MIDRDDIRALWLGYYTMPPGGSLAGSKIVVCAYTVRHEKGVVLFDTGIGEGHEEAERTYRPVRRPLVAELAAAGVSEDDVVAIVNCHFHTDHCGNNPAFPGRPIFAQRAEYEAVRQGQLDYTLPSLIDFDGALLELLDGGADVLPGVRIVATPGHSPGHQSLMVETRQGRVLLAGQAVSDSSDWTRLDFASRLAEQGIESDVDLPAWYADVRALDPQEILFAHDLARWRPSEAVV